MELRVRCPDCEKPNLSINTDKQVGWCYKCKKVFSRNEVAALIKGNRRPNREALRALPVLQPAWEHREAHAYLFTRLVTEEDAPATLYDPSGKRLYFRIYSPSQDLSPSYHTRGLSKDDGWRIVTGTDKKNYVYVNNTDLLTNTDRRAVCVVEGIFDAIRLGKNALSLLGTDYSPVHHTFLRSFQKVVVWMDPDAAGEAATKKIVERLGEKAHVVRGLKEPGDLSPNDKDLKRVKEILNAGA